MRLTATLLMVVVMAKVLEVFSDGDCKGKCNLAFCGQSTGPHELAYSYMVAKALLRRCYESKATPGMCHSKECHLLTVFYRDDVCGDDACDMNSFKNAETQQYCLNVTERNQERTVVPDNKLENCLQHVSNNHNFMGLPAGTSMKCKSKVVLLAHNDLTNSNVTALIAAAQKLRANGAWIRCYVVGWGNTYNLNYDKICDRVTKFAYYRVLTTPGVVESIYSQQCCP